ncbi:hypothetical protein NDU88_004231 [Pleurodeles waltl]|uniref:Uncharacterized protein n=1 Tax=Pleurodeles waltl TaxID=8319 RepID=A0AAV7PBW4_PLEWA|nr:hypothetical protein NDU88_004231 [Pleurodeles waltl]
MCLGANKVGQSGEGVTWGSISREGSGSAVPAGQMSSADRGVSDGPWWESPASEESTWVDSTSVSGNALRAGVDLGPTGRTRCLQCMPEAPRCSVSSRSSRPVAGRGPTKRRGVWWVRLRESPQGSL